MGRLVWSPGVRERSSDRSEGGRRQVCGCYSCAQAAPESPAVSHRLAARCGQGLALSCGLEPSLNPAPSVCSCLARGWTLGRWEVSEEQRGAACEEMCFRISRCWRSVLSMCVRAVRGQHVFPKVKDLPECSCLSAERTSRLLGASGRGGSAFPGPFGDRREGLVSVVHQPGLLASGCSSEPGRAEQTPGFSPFPFSLN